MIYSFGAGKRWFFSDVPTFFLAALAGSVRSGGHGRSGPGVHFCASGPPVDALRSMDLRLAGYRFLRRSRYRSISRKMTLPEA